MTTHLANKRLLTYLFVIIASLLSYVILSHQSLWQGSAALHTVVEVISMVLAITIGGLALTQYHTKEDYLFLILGIGFIGTGLLDGYHAILTVENLHVHSHSNSIALYDWSWLSSRLFLSLAFVVAYLAWRCCYNNYSRERPSQFRFSLSAIIAALSFALIVFYLPLPLAYSPDLFFVRPYEWLPAIAFLFALVGFYNKGLWRTEPFEHYLILALFLNVFGQLLFMAQSNHLFDLEFEMAHLFKLLAYIIVLFGLLVSMSHSLGRLEKMQNIDPVTNLPNHSLFQDRFSQAIAHSNRNELMLGVCFIDLDNFEQINNQHGHLMGDYLINEVSKRIKEQIREEDTLSRHSGDEFSLLLGDVKSVTQCEHMLERIHLALTEPFVVKDEQVNITASSGLTLYPNDKSDIDTLTLHAQHAMQKAKQAGRNRFRLYDPSIELTKSNQHLHLQEIREALSNHELTLYYQPKVNMHTGQLFGFEALIRWLHPEKGVIPPAEFLPLIEDTDVEIQIGHWVIEQALYQLNDWLNHDLHVEVSVNISSHHMQSASFIHHLESTLANYPHVDAKHLQLEVLESSALNDLNAINSILKTCRNSLGVQIALDDFGTGYSSLTHLRSLPVDTVKIDQTFVRDILDDPNDYSIINGMIGLSTAFNRYSIAEGVEGTEHGLMLMYMGCQLAQGFGIARPMPGSDIVDWVHHYQPNVVWMDCDALTLSPRQKKVELFKLMLKRWHSRFSNNIESGHATVEQWPTLNERKCHMGSWLSRQRIADNFTTDTLDAIDQSHSAMHVIAQDLAIKFQSGDIMSAKKGLATLHESVSAIYSLLENESLLPQ
jgi:diguanylate cyclase (GGDEF)-like protein